ncbi:MAG: ATP synthase F0 subunit B [Chloroflexota bacterium]
MQAITETLGIDVRDIVWHTVNYLVLLLCLWWIGFRPVMRKLAEREQRVRESLHLADRARAEATEAEATRDALLATARAEADAILQHARVEAEQVLEAARAAARGSAIGDGVDARG